MFEATDGADAFRESQPERRGRLRWLVGLTAVGIVMFGLWPFARAHMRHRAAVESHQRGLRAAENGDLDLAIASFNEAIRLDSSFAEVYCDRANAYSSNGQFDRAITDYGEAIRLDPKLARAYYNRGNDYDKRAELERAIADFGEAIRLDPALAVAYSNRGVVYGKTGEQDRAIEDLTAAIALDPTSAKSYSNRGYAYFRNGEFDRAIADYADAVRLDPRYARAYRNRAWLWATCAEDRHRDGLRAVESATRACELTDWKDPQFLLVLAAAYAEAGDFESAMKWQTRTLELLPEDEMLQRGFSKVLELYRNRQPYRDNRR